ncbi:MAG: NAD-dependent epimerase/dehydratase family protein [Patescibacteria group bacterium]|jgi:UDP-glucuronate 4-epimerase
MTTTLVTGGAGFIGSHTIKRLIENGENIICVDDFNDYYDPQLKEDRINKLLGKFEFPIYRTDIRDYDRLKQIFKEHKIDRICHLAARAGVRASIEDPFIYQDVNIRGTLNLLELAKDYKISNFVFASSSSVYGGNKKIPFSESDLVDSPISVYAATKKSCELLAHVYHKLYGLNVTGLRFFTAYGPYGRPDMAYFKFTKKIIAGEKIDVYNFGKHHRDFTYIDDVIDGVISALKLPHKYEIFNLGNSHTVDLKYFIGIMEKELGLKAKINMLPMQAGDVEKTHADISKAKKMLRFTPKINIEEGIHHFIQWYKEYYK